MKIEKIISPNENVENLQQKIVKELEGILPDSEIELVGAMAVPMVGRPEIDVMVISNKVEQDSKDLVREGYKQGPIVNEISYLKKYENDIEIGIQIIPPGHKMIDVHGKIIQKLRDNPELRESYETFKKTLNGLGREEYKEKKSAWIKENLLKE